MPLGTPGVNGRQIPSRSYGARDSASPCRGPRCPRDRVYHVGADGAREGVALPPRGFQRLAEPGCSMGPNHWTSVARPAGYATRPECWTPEPSCSGGFPCASVRCGTRPSPRTGGRFGRRPSGTRRIRARRRGPAAMAGVAPMVVMSVTDSKAAATAERVGLDREYNGLPSLPQCGSQLDGPWTGTTLCPGPPGVRVGRRGRPLTASCGGLPPRRHRTGWWCPAPRTGSGSGGAGSGSRRRTGGRWRRP
ncbi:hypothetical protein RKD32_000719 [Streptomyces sp. SAI-195]